MGDREGTGGLRPGAVCHGFEVQQVAEVPECAAVAYRCRHAATGAALLHLEADDEENLFSITVPTPPNDDSGVAHILEHCVLGGSRSYPVRQPFFEMLKMSMGSFINAFTAPAHTSYPVASPVAADLFNLAAVYFDAVFHPLLTEDTFRREGHRRTPADPADPQGALAATGIVYNEMKGYFSRPEVCLSVEAQVALLPDTVYAHSSGGRPEAILDLDYAGLRRFHASHYHPGQALFLTYGDQPLTEYLAFLEPRLTGFGAGRPLEPPDRQARWGAPRRTEATYDPGAGGAGAGQTWMLLQWLAGTATDPGDAVALEVLAWLLDGSEAAPLRRALVESRLGQAVTHSGVHMLGAEAVLQVGLKGSEPERADAFEALVLETLGRLADETFPAAHVEAAFRQARYRHQEIRPMHPLWVFLDAARPWVAGGDPLAFLRLRQALDACQEAWRAEPRLFNRLIAQRLVGNPHRLRTVLRPEPGLQAGRDAALAARLRTLRQTLDAPQLQALAAASAAVDRDAALPNPPEAVALLPQLRRGDVPKRPRHLPTTTGALGGGTLLVTDVPTNGIAYLEMDFDLEGLAADRWPAAAHYAEWLRRLGAAGLDYTVQAHRLAASTGGLQAWPVVGRAADGRPLRRLRVALKALDGVFPEALAVLSDLLFALDPGDARRLRVVVGESLAAKRTGLISGGVATARRRASAALGPDGALVETLSGLPALRRLEGWDAAFDERAESLAAAVGAVRDAVAAAGPAAVSFVGGAAPLRALTQAVERWGGAGLPSGGAPSAAGLGPLRQGLVAPVTVAYCAHVLPAPPQAHPDAPLVAVGAQLATAEYVRPEIRFRGTAYGGACAYDALAGELALLSWQDPHVVRTLDVFARLEDWIRGDAWGPVELDRAVIATLKDSVRPLRPQEVCGAALVRHVAATTPEVRERYHAVARAATAASVRRAMGEALAEARGLEAVCVLAGGGMLEAANAALGDGRQLERIDVAPPAWTGQTDGRAGSIGTLHHPPKGG